MHKGCGITRYADVEAALHDLRLSNEHRPTRPHPPAQAGRQDLRPRIQAIVDELLDAAVAAGHTMDLIATLASPLPTTVTCQLFGIPHRDRERVKAWSQQLTDLTTAEGFERVELTVGQHEGYLADPVRERGPDRPTTSSAR